MLDLNKLFEGYKCDGIIGEGPFGTVYRYSREDNKKQYAAVKIMEVDPQAVDGLVKNIEVTQLMKKNNLVVTSEYKTVEDDGKLYFVEMKPLYLTIGAYVAQGGRLTAKNIIGMAIDAVSGLEEIQKISMVHGDLRIENLLIDEKGAFRLSDLGVAPTMKKYDKRPAEQVRPYIYEAPEVAAGEEPSTLSDIYSLGLIMYCLSNGGMYPFIKKKGNVLSIDDFRKANEKRLQSEYLPALKGDERITGIIEKMVKKNPAERYSSLGELRTDLQKALVYLDEKEKEISFKELQKKEENDRKLRDWQKTNKVDEKGLAPDNNFMFVVFIALLYTIVSSFFVGIYGLISLLGVFILLVAKQVYYDRFDNRGLYLIIAGAAMVFLPIFCVRTSYWYLAAIPVAIVVIFARGYRMLMVPEKPEWMSESDAILQLEVLEKQLRGDLHFMVHLNHLPGAPEQEIVVPASIRNGEYLKIPQKGYVEEDGTQGDLYVIIKLIGLKRSGFRK